MIKVKKYYNRKYYAAALRRYVTLDDLITLILNGEEIEVTYIPHYDATQQSVDVTSNTLRRMVLRMITHRIANNNNFKLIRLIKKLGENSECLN